MANMAAALRTARRLEEREAFDSECRITKPGEGYTDDSGVWHPPVDNLVYEGPCSFLPTSAVNTRTVESAGQSVELHPYRIKVPANTTVEVDHVVEITACYDTAAVGEFYTVRAVQHSQWMVNRILGCERGVS